MFSKELSALMRANRLRIKKIYDSNLLDFASNDYFGLSSKKKLVKKACKKTLKKETLGFPRSSMLVNGYHHVHRKLEEYLAEVHGAEACTLVGSGFLANLTIFDTLVRGRDVVFIDSDYHASGRFITDKIKNSVYFRHNDLADLSHKFASFMSSNANFVGRVFIAIEGVYSMSGDIASLDIVSFARRNNAFLIVDEAHSAGVLGEGLLGFYEYYGLELTDKDVVVGTLSKAYASYGAYIMGGRSTIDFLCSKARSIIYTTSLSAFDTNLALVNAKYLHDNFRKFANKVSTRQAIVKEHLGVDIKSLILSLKTVDSDSMGRMKRIFLYEGMVVGAIRPPTVLTSRLRIILRCSDYDIERLCEIILKHKYAFEHFT